MNYEKTQKYLAEDFLQNFEAALVKEVNSFEGKVRYMINFVVGNKN